MDGLKLMRLKKLIKDFVADQSGATAIEYALLAAILGTGSIVAFAATGGGLSNLFGGSSNTIGNSLSGASDSL